MRFRVGILTGILCLNMAAVAISAEGLLLDDFEDGDFFGASGGTWSAIDDSGTAGNSVCNHALTNGDPSLKALRHEYLLGPDYVYRNTFEQLAFGTNRDLWSGHVKFRFRIRGSGHSMRLKFATPGTIGNYNYYGYTIASTPGSWTEYEFALATVEQENWGAGTFSNTPSHREASFRDVSEIQFVANSQADGESGWFEIDDIWLVSPAVVSNCQIGAFVGPVTAGNINDYEAVMGRDLASVMFFLGWGDGVANNFPLAACNTIDANGSVPHITWEPYTTDIMASILDAILAGSHDSYIDSFANSAKSWGKPLWIRFGHEMNGNWYGWSGAANGANLSATTKYTQTWRYVWRRFASLGVTNVAWVWAPGDQNFPSSAWNIPENYYPGDEFTDWLGMDGYNWYTNDNGTPNQRSFDAVYSGIYATLSAMNADKPMMIGEFASEDYDTGTTKKSNWIADAFQKIKTSYPRIRNYNWFNIKKERNWVIDSPKAGTPPAIQTAMQDPYFISEVDPFLKGFVAVIPPAASRFIDDFEDGDWTDFNGGPGMLRGMRGTAATPRPP